MSEEKVVQAEKVVELERENAELKRENAERRVRLEAFEKEKVALEKESLSKDERLQAKVAELEKKANDRDAQLKAERVRTAIITKAGELGFSNPEHAYLLIHKETDIEVGADGAVTGFEKSLEALAESGSLKMSDQKKSDGLGTPRGKGKPTGDDHKEQQAPTIRI